MSIRQAVLFPEQETMPWKEIAEKLPEVFETPLPVCWSCHTAETFRREHWRELWNASRNLCG